MKRTKNRPNSRSRTTVETSNSSRRRTKSQHVFRNESNSVYTIDYSVFNIDECLKWIHDKIPLDEQFLKEFTNKLRIRWLAMDNSNRGVITRREIEAFVWKIHTNDEKKKLPKKLPKNLLDEVRTIMIGSRDKQETLKFWEFTSILLRVEGVNFSLYERDLYRWNAMAVANKSLNEKTNNNDGLFDDSSLPVANSGGGGGDANSGGNNIVSTKRHRRTSSTIVFSTSSSSAVVNPRRKRKNRISAARRRYQSTPRNNRSKRRIKSSRKPLWIK